MSRGKVGVLLRVFFSFLQKLISGTELSIKNKVGFPRGNRYRISQGVGDTGLVQG